MVCRWIVGLVVSLGVGGLVVWLFLCVLRRSLGLRCKPPRADPGVPGWLTGFVERLFFTILVGVDVTGASTVAIAGLMLGWMGLKLASNWNRPEQKDPIIRVYAFCALLAGLLSMLFAFVGGWICSGVLKLPFLQSY
jgi:hypothetical protein